MKEDKENDIQTGQDPFIMQSDCAYVRVPKTCALGGVFVHQRAHVNTCAYLRGRMGPGFDKRGSESFAQL